MKLGFLISPFNALRTFSQYLKSFAWKFAKNTKNHT